MKIIVQITIIILGICHFASAQFSGDIDNKFNPQDLGFGQGEGFNGHVECVAEQPDGKWLVGGRFTSFNGIRRIGFCRFNANGTLDMGFNNAVGIASEIPDDKVYIKSIKVLNTGKIIIGGYFQRYNGVLRRNICRLNIDGSMDQTYNSNLYGIVESIDVQSDGKVIAAGTFSDSPFGANNNIARLLDNGISDPSFQVIPGFNTGSTNRLYKVMVDQQDRVWCAGSFDRFGTRQVNSVARLQPDGTLDTTIIYLNLPVAGGPIITNLQKIVGNNLLISVIRSDAYQILPNEKLDSTFSLFPIYKDSTEDLTEAPRVVKGFKNQYLFLGNFRIFKGRRVKGYAFVRTDGSLDTTRRFLPQLDLLRSSLFFAELSGKRTLAIGRWMDTLGRSGQATWILDSTFSPILNLTTSLPNGIIGGAVDKLVKLKGNDVLVIGSFAYYNQRRVNSGYIKIDSKTGRQDTSFRFAGIDKILICQPLSGKRYAVYGSNINKENIVQLYDSLYQIITPNPNGWKVDGFVYDICEGKKGYTYLGGWYFKIGNLVIQNLSRLLPSGWPDSTYYPAPLGTISKFGPYTDGRLLVGGSAVQNLVRLGHTGYQDAGFSVFNSTGLNTKQIYFGKNKEVFWTSSGSLEVRDSTGAIFLNSLNTNSISPTEGSKIYDFFVQEDGKIIGCGNFPFASSTSKSRIFRINPDFTFDTSFRMSTGLGGNTQMLEGRTLLPLEDGRFLIGGDFTSYKDIGRNRLAKIYYQRADVLTDSVAGKRFCKAGIQKIAYRCQAFEPEDSLRLQISDSSGSFTNARQLKTVKAKQQDSVSFSFPADILVGNNYRFRWVATAPTAKICFPSDSFGITEALVPNVGLLSSASRDTLCFGDVLKIKLTKQNAGSQPGYRWFVNGAINPNLADSISISAQSQDSLSVRVEMRSSETCVAPRIVQASKKYVTIKPNVSLGPDTNLCQKPGFYSLPLSTNGSVVSWVASTGLSLTGVSTISPGIFSGKLNINNSGCKAVDSVRIEVVAKPILTLSLFNDTIKLSPDGLENIKWFFNNVLLPGQNGNQLSNLQTGTYYSIAQNATGCLDTSAVLTFTEVRNGLVQGNIKLYPQPVKDKLYIDMPETSQTTELVLMDALGRIVLKEKGRNISSISVSKLPAGLYQLKVFAGKEMQVFAVMVER